MCRHACRILRRPSHRPGKSLQRSARHPAGREWCCGIRAGSAGESLRRPRSLRVLQAVCRMRSSIQRGDTKPVVFGKFDAAGGMVRLRNCSATLRQVRDGCSFRRRLTTSENQCGFSDCRDCGNRRNSRAAPGGQTCENTSGASACAAAASASDRARAKSRLRDSHTATLPFFSPDDVVRQNQEYEYRAVTRSDLHKQHQTGPGHPERPERYDAVTSGSGT